MRKTLSHSGAASPSWLGRRRGCCCGAASFARPNVDTRAPRHPFALSASPPFESSSSRTASEHLYIRLLAPGSSDWGAGRSGLGARRSAGVVRAPLAPRYRMAAQERPVSARNQHRPPANQQMDSPVDCCQANCPALGTPTANGPSRLRPEAPKPFRNYKLLGRNSRVGRPIRDFSGGLRRAFELAVSSASRRTWALFPRLTVCSSRRRQLCSAANVKLQLDRRRRTRPARTP